MVFVSKRRCNCPWFVELGNYKFAKEGINVASDGKPYTISYERPK